jgi:hypothetical protein
MISECAIRPPRLKTVRSTNLGWRRESNWDRTFSTYPIVVAGKSGCFEAVGSAGRPRRSYSDRFPFGGPSLSTPKGLAASYQPAAGTRGIMSARDHG